MAIAKVYYSPEKTNLEEWLQVFSACLYLIIIPFTAHLHLMETKMYSLKGPAGEKGDQGTTEIIDYNGNIQEALQVWIWKFYFLIF